MFWCLIKEIKWGRKQETRQDVCVLDWLIWNKISTWIVVAFNGLWKLRAYEKTKTSHKSPPSSLGQRPLGREKRAKNFLSLPREKERKREKKRKKKKDLLGACLDFLLVWRLLR